MRVVAQKVVISRAEAPLAFGPGVESAEGAALGRPSFFAATRRGSPSGSVLPMRSSWAAIIKSSTEDE